MRVSSVCRALVISFMLVFGLGFSAEVAAWVAYHGGDGYHGAYYRGYHGAYYGDYHGGYDGYRAYPYGAWSVPAYVGVAGYSAYGCRYVQTCSVHGNCFTHRVCN